MGKGRRRRGALCAGLGIALAFAGPVEAGTPRAGFQDEPYAAVHLPTSIAFVPDGTMLVTGFFGKVTAIAPDRSQRVIGDFAPILCTGIERGLNRIAVDPEFTTNRFVYVSYIRKRPGSGCDEKPYPANRISRFRLAGDLTLDLASEYVLIDELATPGFAHIGGDIAFGKDGFIYITTGDGACDYVDNTRCGFENDNARDRHTLLGKILRIDRDGGIPPGNPNTGPGTARCNTGPAPVGTTCQETWATGLRNPFRFAMDPDAAGVRFFINDVGQNHWEEVNESRLGADYGWNLREGPCLAGSYTNCPSPGGFTNPVHAYRHDEESCTSITGGAFVPAAAWPPPFAGTYIFGDFTCGKLFRLSPSGSGYVKETFVSDVADPIHLEFGPVEGGRPALYYALFADGGVIRRVRFTGPANRAPSSSLKADTTRGALPLEVAFDASESSDPDADALTYEFDFGDGSPPVVGSSPQATHTYTSQAHRTASVTVRDPAGLESRSELRIDAGYLPPRVELLAPDPALRFSVGQRIDIRAIADDPEDGALAGSAVSITVLRRHADHTHPFAGPTSGGTLAITAPAPEDVLAATNSHLEVHVTATDSDGVATTLVRNVEPRKISVALESSLSKTPTTVNGTVFTTPTSITSWAGWQLNISVPPRRDVVYAFRRWHDNVTANPRTVTPTENTGFKSFYVVKLL